MMNWRKLPIRLMKKQNKSIFYEENMRIRDRIRIGTTFSKRLFGKKFVVTNVDFEGGGNIMVVEYVKCGGRGCRLLYVYSMWDEQVEEIHVIRY